MATGYVTTTTNAAIIPEIWSADIIDYRDQNFVMADLIIKNMIGTGLDTIHYTKFTKLDAEAVTEGTALTGKNQTPTNVDISINRQYAVPFTISRRVMVQELNGFSSMNQYTKMAGRALAREVEVTLLGLYSGLSQDVTCTAGLTEAKILEAIEYLDEAGAPLDQRYAVISPKQKGVLLQLDALVDASQYGDDRPIKNGYVGRIFGLDVFVTDNVVTTGTTTITRHNLIFHKEFAEVDFQGGVNFASQYQPLKVAWDAVADNIYGYGEKEDELGVHISTVE